LAAWAIGERQDARHDRHGNAGFLCAFQETWQQSESKRIVIARVAPASILRFSASDRRPRSALADGIPDSGNADLERMKRKGRDQLMA